SLDPTKVAELADTMREVGLINPITVERSTSRMVIDGKRKSLPEFRLIAGYHRIEAATELGWTTIKARGVRPKSRLLRDLVEIDENLIHAELSELERSEHLAA